MSGGEGTEQLIESTWLVPPWLPLMILLLAAAAAAAIYLSERVDLRQWQRGVLMSLRWLLVAVVVLMLYGWTISRHRTDLPDLVIAIDTSSSMGLEDHYPPEVREALVRRVQAALAGDKNDAPLLTRLRLAQTLLGEKNGNLLSELEGRYHVRLFQIGNAARGLKGEGLPAVAALAAEDETSRLGKCLREIVEAQRGRPTAAIVLFTDGVTTEGPSLVEGGQFLRKKTIPLYIVGLGSDQPPRDLRLTDLLVDEAAFVNDLVHFDARIAADGFTGEATVRLKKAGEDQSLAEAKVSLKPGQGSVPVRLTWRPAEKGEFELVVEVEPQPGEANTDNNRLMRKIVVSDAKLRVLLVQSGPSFEFRFLKTMLERELNADASAAKEDRGFRTVLQEADKEYVETDKSALRLFPATREELFKYDVVIFGDVNPEYLSRAAMENLAEFVTTRGGGLVIIAGPRFTPLAYRDTPLEQLLPIRLETASVPDPANDAVQAFRPRLTPLGLSSPALQLADSPAENLLLWNDRLPPLYWMLAAPDLRPGARVLAEHPTRLGSDGRPLPVIAQQFVGAGRVVFHATDETYRWRFRVGDAYFARYWVQTIRTLSRSKLLGGEGAELTTDRTEYRRGDVVQLRARFLDERLAPPQDDGVTVMLERPGSPRKSLKLRRDAANRGTFEGSATNLADGEYRVWLATPALPGQPAERRFTITAPPGELARLEMDTAAMQESVKAAGGKFYRAGDASNLASDLPRGRQVRIEALPPEPIWNSPWLAALFVAAISAEWLLRKRWGMV